MSVGILVLAGGRATRLPGKLLLPVGGEPLLARVVANLAGTRPTVIACAGSFPEALDRALAVPLIVDRWSLRGPLAGMITSMSQLRTRLVAAVAGDLPFVDATLIDRLVAAVQPGDEAVVAEREIDNHLQREPLAALYDRLAFLREAPSVLRTGNASVHAVLDRLRVRTLRIENPITLTNINTPKEYNEALTAVPQPGRMMGGGMLRSGTSDDERSSNVPPPIIRSEYRTPG